MAKIVTFGEIMLHLQPPSYKRLGQADGFTACYGGSEANTAAALAQWGEHAAFVTKLPDNELGEGCIGRLKALGVDTSYIARGNGRLGVYYTEKSVSPRPPKLLYDRGSSVFLTAAPKDFDFAEIFKGAHWFHFSGITPALGGKLPGMTGTAIEAARHAACRISCDFNFRSLLWKAENARRIMTRLITGIDVLVINENQAGEIFGVDTGSPEDAAASISDRLQIGTVVLTGRRTVSAEITEFSSLIYNGGQCLRSRAYQLFIIDKIGGGDAFSAGIIYGMLRGKCPQETVDFAAAAAAYKHTVEGDMLLASADEIEQVMRSDGSGRLVR